MASLKVEHYIVGSLRTNCYFIINEDTKEMLMVDPGADVDKLVAAIEEEKLNPVAILLTHGHFDHASQADELAEKFGVQIYAEEHEKETFEDTASNLSHWEGRSRMRAYHADYYLRDGEEIELAGFRIRALHTPGHTVGGCSFLLPDHDAVFSGDTLFAGSVGRSDFKGGSTSDLIRGIQEKLMTLPDNVIVYPGHNAVTTIGNERENNPFIR